MEKLTGWVRKYSFFIICLAGLATYLFPQRLGKWEREPLTWLLFVEVLKAAAWPIAILVALVCFRGPLIKLIGEFQDRGTQADVELGPLKASFTLPSRSANETASEAAAITDSATDSEDPKFVQLIARLEALDNDNRQLFFMEIQKTVAKMWAEERGHNLSKAGYFRAVNVPPKFKTSELDWPLTTANWYDETGKQHILLWPSFIKDNPVNYANMCLGYTRLVFEQLEIFKLSTGKVYEYKIHLVIAANENDSYGRAIEQICRQSLQLAIDDGRVDLEYFGIPDGQLYDLAQKLLPDNPT